MFFKKLLFPDFRSTEPVAWLIENAINILVTICLAQSVLDWSKLVFDRSNLIFDRSKFGLKVFLKKLFLSRILHFIQLFKNLFAFSLWLIHLKPIFVFFFLIFLKGFCLQVPVCPFYPFFFILFTYFMHFRCNFWAYRNLGFLIF